MNPETKFVLARIAEEAATAERWREALTADEETTRGVPSWVVMAGGLKDPNRVLARCEQMRHIVAECSATDTKLGDEVVRALAAIWSNHPDYDAAWKPHGVAPGVRG